VLFQFAADFTEKTLFKLIMVRLLNAAVNGKEEDLSVLLSEEILNVDDQLLEIERDTHEVSGTHECARWTLELVILTCITYHLAYVLVVWHRGIVFLICVVTLHRTQLVLEWVTM